MGALKIIVFAVACIGPVLGLTWTEYNGAWYAASDGTPVNWHSARAACLSEGGELASINNENERDKIQEMVGLTSYQGPFWIGLNNLYRTTWGWSDGTAEVKSFWASGYPTADNDFSVHMLCATQETSAWKNDHCDRALGYVCKAPIGGGDPQVVPPTPSTAGYCPTGYFDGLSRENKCFKIVWPEEQDKVTWSEAANHCRGGPGLRPDLASIVDEREAALLTAQMQTVQGGVWMGLNRENTERYWRWSDNGPLDYMNWGPGEPSGYFDNCAEMWFIPGPPGTWNNIDCNSKRGYVCQTFKNPADIVNDYSRSTETACEAGYYSYWYGCYKFLPSNDTWDNQQKTCQQDGGHLASIHYEAENAALNAKVLEFGEPVWIGFKDYQGDGLYTWSDGWQAFYTKWGDNEPSRTDDGGNGGCIVMKTDGRWYDVSCDSSLSAICKKTSAPPITTPAPKMGVCPGEQFGTTDWIKHGAYCYLRVRDRRTWQTAKEQCVLQDARASLASVHSYAENQFLFGYLSDDYNWDTSYWIGLFRNGMTGEYAWTDQSAVIYENWAPGEPNGAGEEDCVEMYVNSIYPQYWNDHGCSEYRSYVCKVPQADPIPLPENVDGTCPDGWVNYEKGAHCYRFMGTLVGEWQTASSACQAYSARLPTINNYVESEWIRNELEERNAHPTGVVWNYWTGLVRDRKAGVFRWVDDSAFDTYDFNLWNQNEPNDLTGSEDCVEAQQADGKWNAIVCSTAKAFVCQVDKTPLSKGLNGGEITGIVFGVLAIVLLIVAIVVMALDRMGVITIVKKAQPDDDKKLVGGGFTNDNYHGGANNENDA